ncbi:hypothetical protein EJG51_015355 [Undibacterium piscinae]|uniref:Uncharacterized protein n=1 Tax=Undibacterium piscinae TaxID=2495591 RepID=A0A6M4A6J0_9BURK|nr:hypothetical protein EJG51_015355 [Undibacterium piscinae]
MAMPQRKVGATFQPVCPLGRSGIASWACRGLNSGSAGVISVRVCTVIRTIDAKKNGVQDGIPEPRFKLMRCRLA